MRLFCRIQSSPWGVAIILMIFSSTRVSQNAAQRSRPVETGHSRPRGTPRRADGPCRGKTGLVRVTSRRRGR
jgi:hypothetical protein